VADKDLSRNVWDVSDVRAPTKSDLLRLQPWRNLQRLTYWTCPMANRKNLRAEALRSAPPDSWVVLSDDESRIVAAGKSYEEAVKASDTLGVADPVLVKTPKVWSSLSV
jgi:hypothetical protein